MVGTLRNVLISELRRVFSKPGLPVPLRAEERRCSKRQKIVFFLSAFHAEHSRGQEAELPHRLDCHTEQSPEPAQPAGPFHSAGTCCLIPDFPCEPRGIKRIYKVGKDAVFIFFLRHYLFI